MNSLIGVKSGEHSREGHFLHLALVTSHHTILHTHSLLIIHHSSFTMQPWYGFYAQDLTLQHRYYPRYLPPPMMMMMMMPPPPPRPSLMSMVMSARMTTPFTTPIQPPRVSICPGAPKKVLPESNSSSSTSVSSFPDISDMTVQIPDHDNILLHNEEEEKEIITNKWQCSRCHIYSNDDNLDHNDLEIILALIPRSQLHEVCHKLDITLPIDTLINGGDKEIQLISNALNKWNHQDIWDILPRIQSDQCDIAGHRWETTGLYAPRTRRRHRRRRLYSPYGRRHAPIKDKQGYVYYKVDKILDVNDTNNTVLVQWKDYPKKHASWEPRSHLTSDCDALIKEYLDTKKD